MFARRRGARRGRGDQKARKQPHALTSAQRPSELNCALQKVSHRLLMLQMLKVYAVATGGQLPKHRTLPPAPSGILFGSL